MNVQDLLVQLFEETGYHREKQVRLKKLSFTGPPPGTYRFDKTYNQVTQRRKAYLTTKSGRTTLEFFCNDHTVTIIEFNVRHVKFDLREPDSLDKIQNIIDEHS
jgi:hypothetical protein